MVSAEEKRKIIKEFLDTFENTNKSLISDLYGLLKKDTVGTKLYKYRQVKDYNLQSIREGTLYCAPAETFNDPFDSKLGLTIGSIVAAQHKRELERITNLFAKTISVFDGASNLSDYTESEQKIIVELLSDEEINKLLAKGKSFNQELPFEEQLCYEDYCAILSAFRKMTDNPEMRKKIDQCMEHLQEYIQKSPYHSVSSYNDDWQSMLRVRMKECGLENDADEIDKVLSVSKGVVAEEKLKMTEESIKNLEDTVVAALMNQFLVGCLTTNCKNRLMWSHYADSHKGFCIEYDYSQINPASIGILPLPIVYSTHRPQFPWVAAFVNTTERIKESTSLIVEALLTKDSAWEYENEWRILIPHSINRLLPMPPISCIYLGACMNKHNRGRILKIARECGIPVKQMKVDRGEFELHAEQIL